MGSNPATPTMQGQPPHADEASGPAVGSSTAQQGTAQGTTLSPRAGAHDERSDDVAEEPDSARTPRPGADMLAWVLVGVLALIAVSLFAFEGQAQSTAIVVSLVLGLVGIVVASNGRKKRP